MKSYVNEGQFRIVGKAWEVRYKLRQLLQISTRPEEPLQCLLARMTGQKRLT